MEVLSHDDGPLSTSVLECCLTNIYNKQITGNIKAPFRLDLTFLLIKGKIK